MTIEMNTGLSVTPANDHEPPEDDLGRLVGRATPLDRIQRQLHSHPAIGSLVVLVCACVIFGLLNGRFLAYQNISIMLQQVAVVAALGIAQTLIILTAGIDLSIGAAMIIAQLIMAKLAADNGVPGLPALLLGILASTLIGALNGTLISRIRLPPFIATLGTWGILTSVGALYANGETIDGSLLPSVLRWTGHPVKIGPFNLINGVLLVAALYVLFHYVLTSTRWGRHVYATGDDVTAARLAGIRTRHTLFSVYLVAGLVVGLAAWVSLGYVGAASTTNAGNINLECITGVVIGGTSLFGGRGGISGTLIGALIVVVFTSGLTLAGVNDLYQPIAIGTLVIVAVGVDQWIRKVRV
jgi:fructose transport system permease protein